MGIRVFTSFIGLLLLFAMLPNVVSQEYDYPYWYEPVLPRLFFDDNSSGDSQPYLVFVEPYIEHYGYEPIIVNLD